MKKELKKKIRQLVSEILKKNDGDRPTTFEGLEKAISKHLRNEDKTWHQPSQLEVHQFGNSEEPPPLEENEAEALAEVYWDLFREKHITFSNGGRDFDTNHFLIHSESKEFKAA